MTRWLEAARSEIPAWTAPTELTEPTKGPLSTVLSVKSVLSEPRFLDGKDDGKTVHLGIVSSVLHPTQTQDDGYLTFDAYEERAAILEFDGALGRLEAEYAALSDVTKRFAVTPDRLKQEWLSHPDAQAYLAFITSHGQTTLESAASGMGWPHTRAWAAAARLRACGLLHEHREHIKRTDTSSSPD